MGGKDRWIPEFEATLIYRLNSRTAQTTQRNPAFKKKEKRREKKGRKSFCINVPKTDCFFSAIKGFRSSVLRL